MVRPGYKQTEVGEIPEDWNVKSIGDIGNIIRGASPRPKGDKRYYGGNVPRLMVEDVTRDGKYVVPCVDFLTEEGKKRSRPCDAGTLTIVCSGTVGVPAFLKVDACIHDGFLALVNIKKWMLDDYIYHYLRTQQTRLDKSGTHGGVFTNLTTEIIQDFKLPVPPVIDEQKAIAKALSDVDGLIASLEKLIAKKRDIKTATMQQLLTGKKRLLGFGEGKGYKQTELGQIPEDWDVKALGELGLFINGRAYGIHEWEEQGTPVIRLQNLTGRGEKYYYSNLKLPEKQYCHNGDLLYMWSATFGPIIWFGDKAIYHYHIWKIECRAFADKKFLYYKLDEMTENLKRGSSSGGTMLHVTKQKMESTTIASPSLEEQKAISGFLSDLDKEIFYIEQRLTKTKAIKQGMMQELLTGRTRLPIKEDAAA